MNMTFLPPPFEADMSPLLPGSLNPPRKAKRPLPSEFLESVESDLDVEDNPGVGLDDPDETPCSESPKRRSNSKKSAPLSRSAREQLRRQNHSKIEKRRRIKINDALSELKRLVPLGFGDEGEAEGEGMKKEEFKLDVLEKTVAYMKHLLERVEQLEGQGQTVSGNTSHSPLSPLSLASVPPSSTSLPSISSWINTPLTLPTPTSPHLQLPSPPSSSSITLTSLQPDPPSQFTLPSPRSSPIYAEEDKSAASALVSIASTSKKFSSSGSARTTAGMSMIHTPSSILGLSS